MGGEGKICSFNDGKVIGSRRIVDLSAEHGIGESDSCVGKSESCVVFIIDFKLMCTYLDAIA